MIAILSASRRVVFARARPRDVTLLLLLLLMLLVVGGWWGGWRVNAFVILAQSVLNFNAAVFVLCRKHMLDVSG